MMQLKESALLGKTNPNLQKECCNVKRESWLLEFLLANAIIAPVVVFN